ncbi:MAG: TRAP transporter substrate-binding protein [Reyranella sp.]|nr:MAG: TRAP transporter substrate-binding protein [Reyranella sp.]
MLGPSAGARDFTSSDILPAGYPTVRAVAYMADLMRERSSGRLNLSDLGADDPRTESYTLGQLRNGTLDMARVNVAALNSAAPATLVLTLPYLFRSTAHEQRVLDGPLGEEILASLERAGFIGLCFYDLGPRSIYGIRPMRTPTDLRGLKYRVQQSSNWAPMVRALGAQPVVMPLFRGQASMRAGVVDVGDGNWSTFVASQHHLAATAFSLTQHVRSPGVLLFSRQVWETLSSGDKAIIRAAARDSVAYHRRLWDDHEAAARRTAEAAGIQVISDVDHAAFASVLMPLHDTVVSDARLRSMIERIKADKGP